MLRYLVNFLYPPRCAACGTCQPIDAYTRLCAACLLQIERLAGPVCVKCGMPEEEIPGQGEPGESNRGRTAGDAGLCRRCIEWPPRYRVARAAARYRASAEDRGGPLPSIIRRHKYGLDQSLGRALAECIGPELPVNRDECDLVVPVPLHRARLRWRGFNQAALLAAAVARRLDRPLDLTTLVRAKPTHAQTGNDLDQRRQNVRHAFAVTRPPAVTGRRVLLVDDVMTTGATVDECASALLEAGAVSVDVFTLARAL